jgi:protein-S-isoprenylcysteine O-methyltransferase Ste14
MSFPRSSLQMCRHSRQKTGTFILRSSHPSIIRLVGVLGFVIVGVILWLIGRTWRRSGKIASG